MLVGWLVGPLVRRSLFTTHATYGDRPCYSRNYKSNFFRLKYPVHAPNIFALHFAQFCEYGSAYTLVTIGVAESAEDILKAVGIRVKVLACVLTFKLAF